MEGWWKARGRMTMRDYMGCGALEGQPAFSGRGLYRPYEVVQRTLRFPHWAMHLIIRRHAGGGTQPGDERRGGRSFGRESMRDGLNGMFPACSDYLASCQLPFLQGGEYAS